MTKYKKNGEIRSPIKITEKKGLELVKESFYAIVDTTVPDNWAFVATFDPKWPEESYWRTANKHNLYKSGCHMFATKKVAKKALRAILKSYIDNNEPLDGKAIKVFYIEVMFKERTCIYET